METNLPPSKRKAQRKTHPKPTYKHEILKVLKKGEPNGKHRIDLVVIKWDSAKAPAVENRRYFHNIDEDEWQLRKQAGLNVDDLRIIQENMDEIIELLTREEPDEIQGSVGEVQE